MPVILAQAGRKISIISRVISFNMPPNRNSRFGAVKDIGPGLDGQRSKLLRVLKSPDVSVVVVEHRDQLARFWSAYIEASLAAIVRRIVMVDSEEMKDDLAQEMAHLLTSFCTNLYGERGLSEELERVTGSISFRHFGDDSKLSPSGFDISGCLVTNYRNHTEYQTAEHRRG